MTKNTMDSLLIDIVENKYGYNIVAVNIPELRKVISSKYGISTKRNRIFRKYFKKMMNEIIESKLNNLIGMINDK